MTNIHYKLVETDEELEAALELRRQVFSLEKGIAESLVCDAQDREALQMIVKSGSAIIGTARIRFHGDNCAKIERMAVIRGWRRWGIGRGIMTFLTDELKWRRVDKVVLHAQHDVVHFYKSMGYGISGTPFEEAGVKHLLMERSLSD
ncbi:GNAT family N-acetyltransferase [Chloroflexota bacterium]